MPDCSHQRHHHTQRKSLSMMHRCGGCHSGGFRPARCAPRSSCCTHTPAAALASSSTPSCPAAPAAVVHTSSTSTSTSSTSRRRRLDGWGCSATAPRGREQQQQQPSQAGAADAGNAGIDPQLQSTAWQQRQQQQQQQQHLPFVRQRSLQQQQQQMQQRQRRAPRRQQQQQQTRNTSKFAACQSYQALQTQLQQCCNDAAEPQQQQLSAADVLAAVEQLGALARRQHQQQPGSSPPRTSSSSSSFLEDQALQHALAQVYASLEQCQPTACAAQQWPQQQDAAQMPPRDTLRCISVLAGLRYSEPPRLAALLEPSTSSSSSSSSQAVRTALGELPMRELALLAANLARCGVRPSKAWLLMLMQAAQLRLGAAGLPELAQLLSGLVRLNVKPTSAWLDALQDRAVECLLERAVRQQVAADRQTHNAVQQQQQQMTTIRKQQRSRGPGGDGHRQRRGSAAQLRDVASLLSALAEARHAAKPQLAGALWGATSASLAASDTAALTDLLVALAELRLVPPAPWLQQYCAATTAGPACQQQYRPWQVAASITAMAKLLATSRQQATAAAAVAPSVEAWLAAMLACAERQLGSFAGRDLVAVLTGMAALQLQQHGAGSSSGAVFDPLPPLQRVLAALQDSLPRLSTDGLAAACEAVVALRQQHAPLGLQLPPGLLEALLREVAAKLPMLAADHLARVLLCVADAGVQPTPLWLRAVAVQLSGKLTLLAPGSVVAVSGALARLQGGANDAQWLAAVVRALDGPVLTELSGAELRQLLALLVGADAQPSAAWLERVEWAVLQQQQQQSDDDVEGARALLARLRAAAVVIGSS